MLDYDRADPEKQKTMPYLDNKLGIVDEQKCIKMEQKLSSLRAFELFDSEKLNKLPLNAKTFCYIHKYLFQDIYPWAGEYRTVNIQKGYSMFYNVEFLLYGMEEIFNNLRKDNYLKNLTRREFVELFSYYSNEFNVLHPFREGNGRVKMIFLTELANRAGFEIDYNAIDHNVLRQAEISAFGEAPGIAPNLSKLKLLYDKQIKEIRNESYNAKCKTIEEVINRFLWVYDRESSVNWMSNHEDMDAGILHVKKLLQTSEGREKIISKLEKCKLGAKPNATLVQLDCLIQKLLLFEKPKTDHIEI